MEALVALSFVSAGSSLLAGPGATIFSDGFEGWPPQPTEWTLATIEDGTIAVSSEAGAARVGMNALRFDSRDIATRQSATLKLDLSAHIGATDLGLEFWAKRSGSSMGKFELAISGDGATWTTIHRETPDPEYRQFTADLDQVLAAENIALDSDVYIRFGHLALIQDFFLDDVRVVRGIDVVGPQVAGSSPAMIGSTGGPLNRFTIAFNEAMDPATVTPGDVTLHDPMGNAIAVTSVSPASMSNTHFAVDFADQNLRGVYRFTLTSSVGDASGNKLNQDGDLLSGEDNDGYAGTVAFDSIAFQPPLITQAGGSGTGRILFGEGFESWPPPGDYWSFAAISGGTIGVSSAAPRSGMRELQFNSMNIKDPQWAAVKIDFSSVAGATDLGLDFWARQTGSSHGAVCVDLSGDGVVWKEAMRVNPAAAYGRFSADLDAALSSAGIALDADVYVRLRHLGLIQDLFVDDFQIVQGVDVAGPRIVSQTTMVVGSGAGPLNQVTVMFDEAIDPASFTTADVTLVDPWGGSVSISGVAEAGSTGATVFNVTFPDQTTRGVYNLTVGPTISDPAGNLLNQDADINPGESEDAHRRMITFESVAAVLSGGGGTSLLVEDFENWPPPTSNWSFNSIAGGTIGVSEDAPHGGLK